MRKVILFLSAFLLSMSLQAREITLLEGPFTADWSDKHCVEPLMMAGVSVGDRIHVYTSHLGNNATAYIRTKANGWAAISKAYDNIRISGDIECLIDETIMAVIKNQTLMFGGSDYTIERVTLITDREEDTREGYDELCNPDATTSTRQIYELLRDCYGKKSISCSMAEVNWNYKEAGYVKTWTGKYPAMNGYDFIHLTYDWEPYKDISPVQEWWDMGGLVTICWHWRAPDSEAIWDAYKKNNNKNTVFEGFYAPGGGSPVTQFSPANAVKEGTWENEFVRSDLEKVADRLLLLQEAGIVVIWRPFHEAAGNSTIYSDGKAWFWWGADGAEPCVKLWKMMFDYFRERNINNLIWVWTSQTKDDDWYPGDEYVDMIGRDLYNYTTEAAAYDFNYITAYHPHKMVALSECGYGGGTSPYISEQWSAGAKWSYAMPWYHYQYTIGGTHQYANSDWWQDWFKQDNAITMDEMKTLRAEYLSKDINAILSPTDTRDNAPETWYTISGTRVDSPRLPGIYISSKGRKVLKR